MVTALTSSPVGGSVVHVALPGSVYTYNQQRKTSSQQIRLHFTYGEHLTAHLLQIYPKMVYLTLLRGLQRCVGPQSLRSVSGRTALWVEAAGLRRTGCCGDVTVSLGLTSGRITLTKDHSRVTSFTVNGGAALSIIKRLGHGYNANAIHSADRPRILL